MQAALMRQFGDPSVLRVEECSQPEPRAGEVLIRVLAAGLNRLDHYLREGSVTRDLALPHVLGSDAAGTVEAVGPGVSGFALGERVIPMPGYPLDPLDAEFSPMSAAPSYAIRGIREWGSYAQFMTVPARWLIKDDTGLPPDLVATLPMPLVTGVRAVKTVGRVQPGELVLVHAGASGTGSMNIQVAKALGAHVATTLRSPAKEGFVRGLGADLVVMLDDPRFEALIRDWSGGGGVHAVIDNLGGPILPKSLDVMRPLGRLVSMGMVAGLTSTIELRPLFFGQKSILGTLMGGMEDLKWGLEQVKAGRIKPLIDSAYPLRDVSLAHQRLARGDACGTVVLLPWA